MSVSDEINFDFGIKSDISFCQACLSFDRKLSAIDEYNDIYRNITNNTMNDLPQPVYLCWECIAVLKKIKLFKAKIEEAQKIVTYPFLNKQASLLKTLSSLTKTCIDNTIIITHSDEDDDEKLMQQKLIIKQENTQSDDDLNYDQNTNEVCLENIKKEIKHTNTTQRKKSLHYSIVSESRNKDLKNKFSIETDDLKLWWEREKNSDFYMKFKYRCKLCIRGFDWKEKLKVHILRHHKESAGQHICPTCSVRFSTESSLCAHMQAHMYAWECARCGFQCYTERRLNAHMNKHVAVQCKYCAARFQDLDTFYSHYKTLHSVYLCDNCGKRCRSKQMLERHMSFHLDIHICTSCGRRYKTRAALRKHFALKHSFAQPEDAYCVLCDKQYANVFLYRRHVLNSVAHAPEGGKQVQKKFVCPECGNTYSRRAYMMNHYSYVHMKDSKHYCSECDRHFLNRTRYVEHMRFIHEGVKKDKNKLCNICGKGFAVTRTLINHIRTHSGERPYECEHCSAKFTQKTSMLSHVKYIHMKSKRRTLATVNHEQFVTLPNS